MGSPKALLNFEGQTFLERAVALLSAECDPVIVVLGYEAGAIRKTISDLPNVVVNPAPERGMLSSLQCGLKAMPANSQGFAFTLVDFPAILPATVSTLAGRFRTHENLLVIPKFGDRRGHPVFASHSLAAEWLALPLTAKANEIVNRHEADIQYVCVDDPGIAADVDDPESYRRLLLTRPA